MAIALAKDRGVDLRLARIHLRFGALLLARAELESLAARKEIDEDGLVDLAEVRWRTGDLAAAGAAAQVALSVHPDDALALVIAAEASVAAGAPGEARKLSARALAIADDRIDALFAGMPRSTIWPSDPQAGPTEPLATLFGPTTTSLPDRGGARPAQSVHAAPPSTAGAGSWSPLTPATGIGAAPLPPFGSATETTPTSDAGSDRAAAEDRGSLSLWGSDLPQGTSSEMRRADPEVADTAGARGYDDGQQIGSEPGTPDSTAATAEVWPPDVDSSPEIDSSPAIDSPPDLAPAPDLALEPELTSVPAAASTPELRSSAPADDVATPEASSSEASPAEPLPREASPLDPAAELDRSRSELAAGEITSAAMRLGFALRLDPRLATQVLGILEGRHEPALELVRGDAYRTLGQEAEADDSYAAARAGLFAPSGDQP
ncbi:MAG TPA: hypothetical protein VIM30_04810 [Candidatus Limnocylindrales bacterium]